MSLISSRAIMQVVFQLRPMDYKQPIVTKCGAIADQVSRIGDPRVPVVVYSGERFIKIYLTASW